MYFVSKHDWSFRLTRSLRPLSLFPRFNDGALITRTSAAFKSIVASPLNLRFFVISQMYTSARARAAYARLCEWRCAFQQFSTASCTLHSSTKLTVSHYPSLSIPHSGTHTYTQRHRHRHQKRRFVFNSRRVGCCFDGCCSRCCAPYSCNSDRSERLFPFFYFFFSSLLITCSSTFSIFSTTLGGSVLPQSDFFSTFNLHDSIIRNFRFFAENWTFRLLH